jgi:hypothetical protein
LQLTFRRLHTELANLDGDISAEDKLMQDHQTSCPKCEHRFIHGFDPKDHEAKVRKAGELNEKLGLIRKQIANLEEREAEFVAYRDALFAVRSQMSKLNSISGFDTLIWNDASFMRYPASVAVTISEAESDLETMSLIEASRARLSEGKLSDNDLAHYQKRLAEYAVQLEDLTRDLGVRKAKLSEHKAFRASAMALEGANSAVQALLEQLTALYEAYLKELYNEGVDAMRASVSSELALVDNSLLKNKMALSGIEMLEKEITLNALDEKMYKAILDELSPTTGLIAEGMVGFINDFIGAMNTLIKKVWSYPMEITPIEVQEDSIDLDYKFPFVVGDDLTPKLDVSEGSSGMLEMFNLVFMVTSLRCLKLLEIPLYLDEFGSKFDKAHRANSTYAIRTLMEELPFTQLFMISHYHSSYGSFANSQTTILCDKNIS